MNTVNTQLFSDSYFAHGFTIFLLLGIFSALYVGLGILFQQKNIAAVLHVQRKSLGLAVIIVASITLSLLLNSSIEARVLLMSSMVSAAPQLLVIKWLLIVINTVCLMVGMLLYFHSDALAKIDATINQWIWMRRHPAMMGKAQGH